MDIPADDPVIIVPYDPTWPDVFDRIRDEIAAVLGSTALAIEHIGSTAVPGLSAKPVIDIDVVVSSPAGITTAVKKLAPLGYHYEGEKGIEGRHAFKQPDHLPAHHLYACAADNLELARHIAFVTTSAPTLSRRGTMSASRNVWQRRSAVIAKATQPPKPRSSPRSCKSSHKHCVGSLCTFTASDRVG